MKTAVDWFYEILTTENWEYKTYEEQDEIFKKVKEMEKQQMADAFYAPANAAEPKNFDEYYKQKYEDESKSNI